LTISQTPGCQSAIFANIFITIWCGNTIENQMPWETFDVSYTLLF
jgi:hypothetical protein